jgi:hypothetical protein
MTEIETKTYWRNSESVEAVRLSEDNIEAVAKEIGAKYDLLGNGYSEDPTFVPNIAIGGSTAFMGDWVTKSHNPPFVIRFVSNARFMDSFQTHEQRMSADQQYAKVYLLVKSVMNKQDAATYHGDGNAAELDLLAIATTKAILSEI